MTIHLLKILTKMRLSGRLGFTARAQKTIISASMILAASAGISAVLGLIKARLLTTYFGVSDVLGVFYTADRIPNLIYSILVVGALSTVFIPVFADLLKKDKKVAWETASSIVSIGILSFLVLGMVVMVFATQIIDLLSVGKFTKEQIIVGANLMRIMIFSQLILVVSSFLTSILQSYKYFVIPALAPVLYNLGMILGIITLTKHFGIYAAGLGVVIGAILHLLIQIPLLRNITPDIKLTIKLKNKHAKKAFLLMPPRIVSVAFNHMVGTINNSLAIIISPASVVTLKFASQLQFFPVHLVGASMAAAALPVLAETTSENSKNKFKDIFVTTLHQMFYLVIPVSVILLVLRIPVVRLVYGVDNFPWEATVKTSYALAFFSLSIFAQSAVYLLTRAFYALKDTTTPLKVFIVTILLNVGLSITFVKVLGLGIWAIALAYSITSTIDMVVLLKLLSKRLGGFKTTQLLIPFTKISYAAALMGVSLYIPLKILDQFVFDTTHTLDLLILTIIAGSAGMAAYLGFTKLFKVKEIELFYKVLTRLKLRGVVPSTVISEPKESI